MGWTTLGAFAWGPDGHRIVGAIADRLLFPETRTAISSILNGDSLEAVANWADQVKSTAQYQWSETLHYIDTPDFECGFNPLQDCPGNWCLTSAIRNYTSLLSTGRDQNEALKFLVHFMGDLHQPLHVGFASDKGGNTLKGRLLGMYDNFHAVWDSLIIQHKIKTDMHGNYSLFRDHLWNRIDSSHGGGDLLPKVSQWTTCIHDCENEWAGEAAKNNCDFVYVDDNGNKVTDGFDLGEVYYQRSIEKIEELLIEGGVRLGYLLNRMFVQSRMSLVV